jgi:hypothetical protein
MKAPSMIAIALLLASRLNPITLQAQTVRKVCSDPTARCNSSYSFSPYQLPFTIKDKLIFGKTYTSQTFYAVILKTVKAAGDSDCSYVDETERVEVQAIWPTRKVFTSRFSCPEELIVYENTEQNFNFLALYAGSTLKEARRVLAGVKTNGRYPQAYIKRMRVVLEYST